MDTSSSSAPSPRQLLTIDLCGLKPALIQTARLKGVTLSMLARETLARAVCPDGEGVRPAASVSLLVHRDRVRLSLRLSGLDAADLLTRSQRAGLPLGSYVVALMNGTSEPANAVERAKRVAALTGSNAELSTLSRNIAQLTSLLRQGSVRAAQQYRDTLDALDGDIRAHLALVAEVLRDTGQRPRRPSAKE